MVDEKKGIQGGMQSEEEISAGRKVAAFVLTLLLLPFLFAAACFGAFGVYGQGHVSTLASSTFILACMAVVGLLIFGAVRAKNPGFRWALILVGIVIAIVLLAIFGR